MVKKILKYCKNFGIITGATVAAYGIFKIAISLIEIVPVVNEIKVDVNQIKSEQVDFKEIQKIQSADIKLLQTDVQNQNNKLDVFITSYTNFLKENPQITKDDLIRYISPIYDELKKNGLTTQLNMPESGGT